MALSSYRRVYVPLHCSRCGKEENEGHVFGVWRARHLRAQTDTREMVCDSCLEPPKLRPMRISSYFDVPAEEAEE